MYILNSFYSGSKGLPAVESFDGCQIRLVCAQHLHKAFPNLQFFWSPANLINLILQYKAGWWFGPFWIFPLRISSSQLTNSIIFQRGRAQPPTRKIAGKSHPSCQRCQWDIHEKNGVFKMWKSWKIMENHLKSSIIIYKYYKLYCWFSAATCEYQRVSGTVDL